MPQCNYHDCNVKIAVCGTHGVGKTTLARALSDRLGVPMIHEVARRVIKVNGYENTREYIEKADKKQKEIIQCDIFQEQVTWEREYESFVADRSVFDAVAYTKVYFRHFYGVDQKMVNWLLGQAVGHALNTYDLLVYVPPFWVPEEDGFRDVDENLWLQVKQEIERYVDVFGLLGGNVLEIETKNLDSRIYEVMLAVKRSEAKSNAV